ncbi:MAG: ABC transporter substrate-binding protein [Actinomycetota bacterium]
MHAGSRRVTRQVGIVLAAALLAACGSDTATSPATETASSGDASGGDVSASEASSGAAAEPAPTTEPTSPPSTAAPTAAAPTTAAPTTVPEPEPIVVVDDRGVEVTIESTERIIPADGDLAEIVFALGLGDQVVATDLSATFPPAADAKPEIGYQRALSPEPILAFEPTVILATEVAGPPETLSDLEDLGVPVVIIPSPATPEGPGVKIRAVADALGVSELGAELADGVDAGITEVAAAAPDDSSPKVVALYVRGENTQLVLGTESPLGWMIDAVGATNVAVELGVDTAVPINIEAMIQAAPDVIIIPSAGLESVGGLEGFLEIPGFAETPAGQAGRVLAYDDQYLLGNGPRTPDLLAEMLRDVHATNQ